ncbi:MAG: hypothetical protein QCI82_11155 [Candidatus Thermoplasmatota archaeon]|nr:hypothetical protein [Candidatus Thermoplasmatota archaeon]
MYFLTRSEILRLLEVEDDSSLLIASAPKPFLEWFDPCIGSRTKVTDRIPTSGGFDRILVWMDSLPEEEMIDAAIRSLNPDGQLWVVLPMECPGPDGGSFTVLDQDRKMLRSI